MPVVTRRTALPDETPSDTTKPCCKTTPVGQEGIVSTIGSHDSSADSYSVRNEEVLGITREKPLECLQEATQPVAQRRAESRYKRRSCAFNIRGLPRPHPPTRSNSCPAVIPNHCLLGTFEESVLNGRLRPCGSVEGFTAQLGASGSFRPPHVTLSVETTYFSVDNEHGGTGSPYLGYIDLSSVGPKGYRVPRQGTIQLTLFNPNNTVVKMFIVTFDLSDMPSCTQTFLRQKTLSHTLTPPHTLHYLIHLRFQSSRTGHIYLKKNIKLIFAHRAPDTMDFDPCPIQMYTVCEGPTQPRYCPLLAS